MMAHSLSAVAFSQIWEAAWNARDVEAVLKHFHDEAVFTSPVARQIGFSKSGRVVGKDDLRRYWTQALAQNPNLHFHVTGVYQGVDNIIIAYQNQMGVARVEVLFFREGLIVEGHGAFVAVPPGPG